MIRCEHCGQSHNTISQVRACPDMPRPVTPTGIRCGSCKGRHETVDQVRACYVPVAPRNLNEVYEQFAAPEPMPSVPDGYYAIVADAGIKFYKVRNGRTGSRWQGYTFVDVQAGDDLYPIRSAQTRREILSAIASDPRDALSRYGRELGVCGHCGRTLTDEQSRALGIGPVCRERV